MSLRYDKPSIRLEETLDDCIKRLTKLQCNRKISDPNGLPWAYSENSTATDRLVKDLDDEFSKSISIDAPSATRYRLYNRVRALHSESLFGDNVHNHIHALIGRSDQILTQEDGYTDPDFVELSAAITQLTSLGFLLAKRHSPEGPSSLITGHVQSLFEYNVEVLQSLLENIQDKEKELTDAMQEAGLPIIDLKARLPITFKAPGSPDGPKSLQHWETQVRTLPCYRKDDQPWANTRNAKAAEYMIQLTDPILDEAIADFERYNYFSDGFCHSLKTIIYSIQCQSFFSSPVSAYIQGLADEAGKLVLEGQVRSGQSEGTKRLIQLQTDVERLAFLGRVLSNEDKDSGEIARLRSKVDTLFEECDESKVLEDMFSQIEDQQLISRIKEAEFPIEDIVPS